MRLFFILLLIGASTTCFSQDKIYTRDGTIIQAHVLSAGDSGIVYKRQDNPNGPTYRINEQDADKIEFENGTVRNSQKHKTHRKPHAKNELPESKLGSSKGIHGDRRNYGNNLISFIPINFFNDIYEGGIGLGADYEHFFDQGGYVSLEVPITVNFDNPIDNYSFSNGNYALTPNKQTALYGSVGCKFYPTGSKGIVRYAVGPALYVSSGTEYFTENFYPGTGMQNPLKKNYISAGFMVSNSINIFPTPHLFAGADFRMGIPYYDNRYDFSYTDAFLSPIVSLMFKFGYRF